MQRIWISILTLLFFIWLLPLGIFIKPSQEKIACDGQRAFCMCSHVQGKLVSSPMEGNSYQASTGHHERESASHGGAPSYFLAFSASTASVLNLAFLNPQALLAYNDPFYRSIEHVPKA